jgi:uncharacterized protein YebE (UPF0316 family)
MVEQLAGALLIFVLRVADVSIGTMRMLYAVRGRRSIVATLGLLESGIFIFAISRVFKTLDENPWNMAGYAFGYSAGTFVGMTVERWIGSGWILTRVISRKQSQVLLSALREANFGVTAVEGHGGRDSNVFILFIVSARRRGKRLLELIRQVDPDAFVTTDAVNLASGGYVPHVAGPMTVRK